MHSGIGHNMQSPQKQFTIKKMTEFKNKVMVNAQKTVELTLKKKDQVQMHQPKPPSNKTNFINKKSTNKMLVATRCNVNSNNDLPSLERFFESTSNNQAEEEEEVFVRKLSTKKIRDLSDVLKMQKIEIKVAKDALA